MRIGMGYDAHRLVPGRKLILGGVEIPYAQGLLGHSDADVLTHVIIDSLLGAAKLGDIGRLFPDTDDSFLNINSLELLKQVSLLLSEAGYAVVNIDSVIIAQEPKLSPYLHDMEAVLADTLGIDRNCINVKATTEEKMGFTGSKEGMAAHAVCLINYIN